MSGGTSLSSHFFCPHLLQTPDSTFSFAGFFGDVTVGNSKTLPVSVSNNGKTSLTIFQESVTGTGFSFSGPTLPLTLAPQQSVSFNMTFFPETGGIAAGGMSVVAQRSLGGKEKRWS